MTDDHVPTAQETAIYQALNAGDHDAIDQMRADAYAEPTSIQQFDEDYANAWGHYQADHEPPEEEREENTADATLEANSDAAQRQEGVL